ncbi:MAG: FtsW/RodA/SpoVE family cell cycle protein [Chloroflexota bacterium]|nr:FtsW/RodA/SpoVE family cell cycle protein [Chloroflexota bacterium]
MSTFRPWRHFDYVLLIVTVLLTAYGVLMIYSANQGSIDPDMQDLWRRQAMFGAAGVGLIFLLAVFPRDYGWLGDFWWLAYLLAVVLLVLVYFFGSSEIGEVSGWLDLGFFQFQPSFLAMNLLTISVGAILSQRRKKRRAPTPLLFGAPKTSLLAEEAPEHPGFVNYLASIVMTLVLVVSIFMQPDMATAAVLIFMWLAMLFESDMPMRFLVFTGLLGLGSLIPLWDLMARYPYMQDRVFGFINPGSNDDVAYQINQAAIAIGSGGVWGKGFAQGTQSQLRYLPVRHTDFIFAVLAEELGFAGVMLLFVLYLVLFLRLLRIILMASDVYGRLLATGTLAMILFQLAINVGMNLGLLPIAGLPLPFISYGNSALLTTMIGIGMAENVAMRHRKLEFQGR